jgi:hypothetical protein
MVWGMSIPSSYGDFWPEGQLEGMDKNFDQLWRQRLDRYYQSLPPEEQKALFDYGPECDVTDYQFYVFDKFFHELGKIPGNHRTFPPLNGIKSHEPPQFFVTYKSHTSLASLIVLLGLAVDEALKAIIERFEPGVHQFFPIEIRMPRGKVYPVQYYTLVIGQYINGFVPEKSKEGSYREYPDYPDYYSLIDSRKEISGLAHSKSAIGKAHLWRERDLNGALICFSDELESAIVGAGLRLPKHYRMMEV